jgi:EmrB/QacA subfamily drug resistance transporter
MDRTSTRPYYRWLVLGIVMTGTLMAILDSSIVNVALPHMMSAFGVDREAIEWVATAFMLASAVAMPLIGWLTDRLTYKTLYLGSLFLFTLGSAFCALAWSMESLIFARIVQAVGGGAIQPIGMALVASLFEPHERGRALGIWSMGIMVGPAVGPTLGGYLTDWLGWRSIFSVNLPIGVLLLATGLIVMKRHDERSEQPSRLDILGYAFLSLFLIAGLLALSNGSQKGWDSTYVLTASALAVIGLVLFLGVEFSVARPLLDLHLFQYRNYTMSMTLAVFRAIGLFGGVFLLPIFLENLVGYTTLQTGLWMMPGALAVGAFMPVAGRLSDRFNPRPLVFIGTALAAFSMFLYGRLDPLSGALGIIGPQIVRGIGLALMMAPLMTAAMNAVPRRSVPTAASFLNIMQRVGGAFGIALLNTYVTGAAHRHAVHMGEVLPAASVPFSRLASLSGGTAGATALAAGSIAHRAQVLAFQNAFVFTGIVLLIGGCSLSLLLAPDTTHIRPGAPAPAPSPAGPVPPGSATSPVSGAIPPGPAR